MNIIVHRRNSLTELAEVNPKYGIEVDIRSIGDQLIVNHEPYSAGESLENWITGFQHRTLILNVKEEGLEFRLIDLMKERGIEDYFFLDQTFPFLIKLSNIGERRCALRVSEFESIESALSLAGRVDWVWLDYFTHLPIDRKDSVLLKSAGFKLCLASPELQGHNASAEIPKIADQLRQQNVSLNAVCTKYPDLWEQLFWP